MTLARSNSTPGSSRAVAITIATFIGTSAVTATAYAGDFQPVFDTPWIGYDTAVYPQGLDPWDSQVADFNGDGIPDLATVSWSGTAYLSILLGTGDGRYATPLLTQLQFESLGVAAADFDRDGDVDLAICETGRFWEGQLVAMYRNDGAANFSLFASYFSGENGPSQITAADFNGDGWTDVAVAHDEYINFGNTAAVLLNNGAGGFRSPQLLPLQAGTRAIDSGDIDGDGDIDAIVGHETNRWTILRNNGNGVFAAGEVIPGLESGSIPGYPQVHIADVDLDGDNDVFFSNIDTGGYLEGDLGLWRNRGDGTFDSPETLDLNWVTSSPVDVNTADVTGDGWPDVLAATFYSGNWFLFASNGAGGFLPAQRFRAGESPISMQASDLDLDSDLDVTVVASQSLEACVYLNPGNGSFEQRPPIAMTDPSVAPAFTTNLASGDIDHDGDLDLAIGSRSDFSEAYGINVRRNNGDASFAPIESYPDVNYALTVRLADIDGDSSLDLFWLDSEGRFKLRRNLGNGSFGPMNNPRSVFGVSYFELHDIDGDLDLDVIAAARFEAIALLNIGGGQFSSPIRTEMPDFFETVSMGEFTGDGVLDLLTDSGIQGFAEMSVGHGDGRFGPTSTVSTGRSVTAFDSADVDSDGNQDFVAVYNLDEKGLSVRRGRGNGDFFILQNFHGSYGTVDHTSSVHLVDANGDGLLDAITSNFAPQDFSFWAGNGDGTFQRLTRYGVGQHAFDLNFGDFDGDGIGDVAVTTQVDDGRWWYPGVIILPGLISGEPDLTLAQTELHRGQPATFTASGAQPGETIYFLYSLRGTGAGPCPPQLGGLCLDLLAPVEIAGNDVADAGGVAELTITIPDGAPLGREVHTQAVARRGPNGSESVKSNFITDVIQP